MSSGQTGAVDLRGLIAEGQAVLGKRTTVAAYEFVERQAFDAWRSRATAALLRIDPNHYAADFRRRVTKNRPGDVKSGIGILAGCAADFESGALELPLVSNPDTVSALQTVIALCDGFHRVVRQLQTRYDDRGTLEVNDEYDVQDLFHALLRIWFDDVRPEEWCPSYAGSASRTDFLLKKEKIVIEIKKTRPGLKAKALGEQLIIDSRKYEVHPDCQHLICFVYDPEARIANPKGLEADLTRSDPLPVSVFIRPVA